MGVREIATTASHAIEVIKKYSYRATILRFLRFFFFFCFPFIASTLPSCFCFLLLLTLNLTPNQLTNSLWHTAPEFAQRFCVELDH